MLCGRLLAACLLLECVVLFAWPAQRDCWSTAGGRLVRVADQPHGCATARMDPIVSCLIKLSSDNFHTTRVAGQFRGRVCPCVEPASAGWVKWGVAAAGLHVPCPLCALPSVLAPVVYDE